MVSERARRGETREPAPNDDDGWRRRSGHGIEDIPAPVAVHV